MHRSGLAQLVAQVVIALTVVAAESAPVPLQTGDDLLARSFRAHGGEKLSSWRTIDITGTIDMEDGITYRSAYRIRARQPDKLKVDQDMTVARGGRYFYEYFRNGDLVWSRRNLVVGKADPARVARWMNQCFGVGYYAKQATAVALEGDGTSEWMTKSGTAYQVSEQRPAHVVTVTLPAGSADLYIDKATFYLLEERTQDSRRLYSGFKTFEGRVHPTLILEITKGRNGEVFTPITYDNVRYDTPIEDWIFEEDMPAKK